MSAPEAETSSPAASSDEESPSSSGKRARVSTVAATADVTEQLPVEPQQSSAGPSVSHVQTDADIKPLWNLMQIFTELGTEEDCIVFCEERGLIPVTKKCMYHKRPMILTPAERPGQLGLYRCKKSYCNEEPVPRSQGTWFENMNLTLPITFQIMYLFCHGASYDDVQRETAQKTGPALSEKTIANWYNYCREVILIYEIDNQIYETKIGGPNKVVVIDESKFTKRKSNRAKQIEGHLFLGMIGSGSEEPRLEVCPKKDRSPEVLVPLIQKHVAEGSIVRTGLWSGYDCLQNHGYIHEKVNLRKLDNRPLVLSVVQRTQRIESEWRKLRYQFKRHKCNRDFLDWLAEHTWRRKNKEYKRDPFEELIKAVKHAYS